MTKTPKRPRDPNQLAKYIIDVATTELPEAKVSKKAEAGRMGGLVGGKARADALDPQARSEIARRAAKARWKKTI